MTRLKENIPTFFHRKCQDTINTVSKYFDHSPKNMTILDDMLVLQKEVSEESNLSSKFPLGVWDKAAVF